MSATAVSPALRAQRLESLRLANAKRMRWAAFKADVRADSVDAGAVLFDVPSSVRDMPVVELLKATPWVGVTKREAMLRQTGVPGSRPLGRLTERQRAALVSMLPRRAGGRA